MKFVDDKTGFKSVLYKDWRTGEYIYATAGTDFTSVVDWINNGKQLIGASEQYAQSVENAKILAAKLGNKLRFTGHSLGGGMAALNAMVTGLDATTFNAAGLSKITIFKYGGAGFHGLLFNWRSHVTAYIMTTDPLNFVQSTRPYMSQAQGTRVFVRPVTFSGWYNGHSIQNFIDTFKH